MRREINAKRTQLQNLCTGSGNGEGGRVGEKSTGKHFTDTIINICQVEVLNDDLLKLAIKIIELGKTPTNELQHERTIRLLWLPVGERFKIFRKHLMRDGKDGVNKTIASMMSQCPKFIDLARTMAEEEDMAFYFK